MPIQRSNPIQTDRDLLIKSADSASSPPTAANRPRVVLDDRVYRILKTPAQNMALEINAPNLLPHVPMPIVPPADATTAAVESVPGEPIAITTRVLHVVNGENFSGVERVQSHLGRCLPKFGVAADFACVRPDKFT